MSRAVKNMMQDSPMLFSVVFLILGLIFLIYGIYTRVTAIKIQGIVKGFAQGGNGDYRKIIEFEHNGELLALPAANAKNRQKGNIGDEVTVFYRPGNKKHVNVQGDNTDILVGGIAILLAVVVAISNLL